MEMRSRDNATVNAAGFDKVCPVSQHLTRQLSAVNPLVDGKGTRVEQGPGVVPVTGVTAADTLLTLS